MSQEGGWTPLTDAIESRPGKWVSYLVMLEHARSIERRLVEAKAALI